MALGRCALLSLLYNFLLVTGQLCRTSKNRYYWQESERQAFTHRQGDGWVIWKAEGGRGGVPAVRTVALKRGPQFSETDIQALILGRHALSLAWFKNGILSQGAGN